MVKNWITKAFALLDHTLHPMPHEINELDWKESLSPKINQGAVIWFLG
jgi:ATP-dependent DNA helicase RecG